MRDQRKFRLLGDQIIEGKRQKKYQYIDGYTHTKKGEYLGERIKN